MVHEKPNSIGIDEIRGQLINDVGIRPYESPYKIYIVNDADKLTLQAQNALLKTIEEPPAYAVILLLADNPDALLPTITSRCVLLSLKPVGDRLVKDYLMERMHIPDYQAEVQAAFARAISEKRKKPRNPENSRRMTANALQLLKRARSMAVYELVEAVRSMSQEKDNIYEYLELFLMWFRDVLLFKATKEVTTWCLKKKSTPSRNGLPRVPMKGWKRLSKPYIRQTAVCMPMLILIWSWNCCF